MSVSSAIGIFLILVSPIIVFSHTLILCVWIRYKRLRTPSNMLIVSLSACDLGLGLLIPAGIVVDLRSEVTEVNDPSFPENSSLHIVDSELNLTLGSDERYSICESKMYCFHLISSLVLSSMSLVSIAAIALDRFLSVSLPLRYNHFVTVTHVQRFLFLCWIYLSAVFLIPIKFYQDVSHETLIFYASVFVFLPTFTVVAGSYCYIYVIARNHAKQIISVEISLHDLGHLSQTVVTSVPGSHHRYGLTLALLVGDMLLWCPLYIISAVDILTDAGILNEQHWRLITITPIGLSIVLNPWLYAYRSSEVRNAVLRVLDTILLKVTGRCSMYRPVLLQTKNGDLSYGGGSNVRLLAISATPTTGTVPGSHTAAEATASGTGGSPLPICGSPSSKHFLEPRIDPPTSPNYLTIITPHRGDYQVSSL